MACSPTGAHWSLRVRRWLAYDVDRVDGEVRAAFHNRTSRAIARRDGVDTARDPATVRPLAAAGTRSGELGKPHRHRCPGLGARPAGETEDGCEYCCPDADPRGRVAGADRRPARDLERAVAGAGLPALPRRRRRGDRRDGAARPRVPRGGRPRHDRRGRDAAPALPRHPGRSAPVAVRRPGAAPRDRRPPRRGRPRRGGPRGRGVHPGPGGRGVPRAGGPPAGQPDAAAALRPRGVVGAALPPRDHRRVLRGDDGPAGGRALHGAGAGHRAAAARVRRDRRPRRGRPGVPGGRALREGPGLLARPPLPAARPDECRAHGVRGAGAHGRRVGRRPAGHPRPAARRRGRDLDDLGRRPHRLLRGLPAPRPRRDRRRHRHAADVPRREGGAAHPGDGRQPAAAAGHRARGRPPRRPRPLASRAS